MLEIENNTTLNKQSSFKNVIILKDVLDSAAGFVKNSIEETTYFVCCKEKIGRHEATKPKKVHDYVAIMKSRIEKCKDLEPKIFNTMKNK